MKPGDHVSHKFYVHVVGFAAFGTDGEVVALLCEPGKWYHCDDWVAIETPPTCLICVAKDARA